MAFLNRARAPVYPGAVQPPTVLVVDYGAQYAQLIARRVREAQVYSEIVPGDTSVEEIVARKPAAVILSGGPASVYADGARRIDPALFDAGIPVLGLCYGFQAMALALGAMSYMEYRHTITRFVQQRWPWSKSPA